MSEKKSDEDRQKEVDRQLELMKAAIGDDNFFNESDSEDSDDSDQLKQRSGSNRDAVELARKFLLDEMEGEDEEVLLGYPYPTTTKKEDPLNVAVGMGSQRKSGFFGSFSWGRASRSDSIMEGDVNLMDASQAHAGFTSPKPQSGGLKNLLSPGGKHPLSFPSIWNDAQPRDSEEFIQENSKSRFSFLACLWGSFLWLIALGAIAAFGYYVYDFVKNLRPKSTPIETPAEKHSLAIQNALVKHGVLTEAIPNSPQAAALQWIIEDTNQTSTKANDPYLAQRYSLAVVYYSTKGQHWANSDGWLSNEGYCQWYGVQCLGSETSIDKHHGNGPVFDINLSSNQLMGNIPTELNAFQDLFFLDFKENKLEGTLSNDLGGWTGLRMFSVAHNRLYGSIPPTLLSTSPDLRVLNLSHNRLVGTIPPVIGDATNLREIHLEYNDMHGHLPDSLRTLDRVETLHLAGNQFSGSLPDGIYDMARLETLYLHDNSLTGHLSNDFAMLSHLELLTLNHNQLVGTVPNVFTKSRHLLEAHLHGNELTGTMPPTMCDLRTLHKLSYLSVDCTKTNNANEMGVSCECCTDCK